MKEYLHKSTHRIPLYDGKFVVILSNSHSKIKKEVPYFDNDQIFAHAYGGRKNGWRTYWIVLNFHEEVNDISHGTICHECHHATHFMLDDVGVKMDVYNDEPFAYLSGWVCNKVYDLIKKHKFKVS